MKITETEDPSHWITEQMNLRPEDEKDGWCCTYNIMENIKEYSKVNLFIAFIYGE